MRVKYKERREKAMNPGRRKRRQRQGRGGQQKDMEERGETDEIQREAGLKKWAKEGKKIREEREKERGGSG